MSLLGSAEFKVGMLVVAIGALIAVMSMQVSDDPSYLSRSKKAWFLLPNASGLVKNSAIRSAGIPVGVIKDITLQDGMARIDITFKSDINMTKSGSVELRASGILGDKHVELLPGSPTDAPLDDGEQILSVKDKGSLDSLVGEITDVSKSLREAVTDDGTDKHVLGRIVRNIEVVSADLAEITSQNKKQINLIVKQVGNITGTLDKLINDESEKGFKTVWKNAMERIDTSLKNIEEITSKINRGEGTIGKLINDETTAEELSNAIEGVGGLVDSANKISTAFEVKAAYLNEIEETKSEIGIQIQPGPDRYYYLGIVNDPAGVVQRERSESTVAGSVTDVETKKTYYDKIKFTALFAKNFYDFTLKGGLIENSGGVGLDYSFFRKKAKFSIDAFDLSKTNLRATLAYKLGWGFYVQGGIYDSLNKQDKRSGFVGAGLLLTNDDLKLLLTRSPF